MLWSSLGNPPSDVLEWLVPTTSRTFRAYENDANVMSNQVCAMRKLSCRTLDGLRMNVESEIITDEHSARFLRLVETVDGQERYFYVLYSRYSKAPKTSVDQGAFFARIVIEALAIVHRVTKP